ncbi:hypothetical protein TNCV_2352731 [Trichonephila clavipes]|nr:hypothetical protein TNCV_2352731 [Trichonephila clavipes]
MGLPLQARNKSKQWVENGVSVQKKTKSIASAGDVMARVFWETRWMHKGALAMGKQLDSENDLLGHSAFSDDLASSDFHLFPKFKTFVSVKGFFAMLPVLGKKAVLEWCMKEGLIGSSYACPKCGKSMQLRERTGKKVNDRF